MSLFDIFILAIALSIDATVVSFSNGLIFTKNRTANSLLLAFSVGFFQFLMPVIGYFFANLVVDFVQPFSSFIVFMIFTILGVKFIFDAFKKDEQDEICQNNLGFKYIFIVSVATSIDALSAGVSLSFSGDKIFFPSIVIGVVTFINSLIAFWTGNLFKNFQTKYLTIFGGVILIALAFKILFQSF
ncbi:MAG: manganese efflux pump MntP family protein [bacterium]|nr:manganese efflux pump MntP family protein [bacterium]